MVRDYSNITFSETFGTPPPPPRFSFTLFLHMIPPPLYVLLLNWSKNTYTHTRTCP